MTTTKLFSFQSPSSGDAGCVALNVLRDVLAEEAQRIDEVGAKAMNPLSHSQTVDRYRPEIEDAIFAVNDLEQAVREAFAMRHAGTGMLREMLLSLLARQASVAPASTSETKAVENPAQNS